MYTLPVTCKDLGILAGAVSFIMGIVLLVTQSWQPWNWWIIVGLVLVVPPVFFGGILGIEVIYNYLSKRIKCKCEKK